MRFDVWGSNTDEQYSKIGRTRVLYAISLIWVGHWYNFHRKFRVLLAFEAILLMCEFEAILLMCEFHVVS